MIPPVNAPEFEAEEGWHPRPAGPVSYGRVSDVAIGPGDEVFLSTRRPGMVVVLGPDGSYRRSWGQGIFHDEPHGISVTSDRVYCADTFQHVIRIFTLEGEPVGVLGTPGMASDTGIDLGIEELFVRTASIRQPGPPFNQPTKAVESIDGDIYVTDGYGNARVHQFANDGTWKASWGHPGPMAGQFRVPHSLCLTGDGSVLVCDRENERIQVFYTTGKSLGSWTDLQRPASVAVADDTTFYVAELGWTIGAGSWTRGRLEQAVDARISLVDASGTVIGRWTSIGSRHPVSFRSPHGLAPDSTGDLYVCDLPVPGGPSTMRLIHKLHRVS